MSLALASLKPVPQASGLPLIGNLHGFFTDPLATCQRLERRHGPVFRTRILVDAHILLGPDANQFVLQNRDGLFSSRGGWSSFIDPVFPGAIMSMDDPAHRFQRRIMQSAFKKPSLVRYVGELGPRISERLAHWQPSARFPVFDTVKQLTLDIATSVFMGEEIGPAADRLNQAFIDTVEGSLALLPVPLPPFKLWRGVRGRSLLVEHFRQLLPAKRASDAPDFFSQFCHARDEQGRCFSDQEVIDHMIFLMMAAHDTTTSTMSTLFHLLGREPRWQERLREASLALPDDTLGFDDLERLDELGWCMQEALRLAPPLTSIPRRTVRDAEFAGHYLPQGSVVGVFPLHTHHMPSLWRDPARFDPERFSPARAEHRGHPFQWIPFGGGAHMCIGQHFADLQVKAVMHQILRRFRWSLAPGYRLPVQPVPIMKPADGLPVRLTRIR